MRENETQKIEDKRIKRSVDHSHRSKPTHVLTVTDQNPYTHRSKPTPSQL